jgi:hypothetical protein
MHPKRKFIAKIPQRDQRQNKYRSFDVRSAFILLRTAPNNLFENPGKISLIAKIYRFSLERFTNINILF